MLYLLAVQGSFRTCSRKRAYIRNSRSLVGYLSRGRRAQITVVVQSRASLLQASNMNPSSDMDLLGVDAVHLADDTAWAPRAACSGCSAMASHGGMSTQPCPHLSSSTSKSLSQHFAVASMSLNPSVSLRNVTSWCSRLIQNLRSAMREARCARASILRGITGMCRVFKNAYDQQWH